MSDATLLMNEAERQQAAALSEQPRQPPLRVPGYEREQFVGKGAYGEVWQAVNTNNGRRVAIKFYSRRGGLDWSLLSREVEKLSFLFSDRYVVQLFDVGWDANPPYYVMEFMEQGSLEDRLQSGNMTSAHAVELFHEIAVGLLHAHEKGILHCDLKPANILLDQDLKPRLADFGQSRLTHEQSPALGTLFYMAPEQADLNAAPDTRWDVYALGAILYRMLTGEPPYRTSEALQSVSQQGSLEERLNRYRTAISKAPRPTGHRRVPGVDPALAHIVDRCLASKPGDRYPNVQAVLDALRERRLRQARQPLLVLGLFGPALVLLVMAIGGAIMLNNVLSMARQELTKVALEGNRFTAHAVANRFALEVDKRWRILEHEAADPELRQHLSLFSKAADDAARRTAQAGIQDWLDRRAEAQRREFTTATEPRSWFITAAGSGAQVARSPYLASTIDRPFWYRDYFHGLGKDLDPLAERPAQVAALRQPHRSIVFKGHGTKTYLVAFSAPIWGDDRNEPLGVLSMSSELGHFVEFDRARSQFATLIDLRPAESGKKGLIVVHPDLGKMQSQKLEFFVAEPVVAQAVRLEERHLQERQHRPQGGKPDNAGDHVRDYVDPVDEGSARAWLATMEPVIIPRGGGTVVPAGWTVIVQEPAANVTQPIDELQGYLLNGIAISAALVIMAVALLWGFVVAVLNASSRSRLIAVVRKRLGLPTATPSTGTTGTT